MKILFCGMLSFCLVIGVGFNASAAPAPTLFAYNETTKQCGSFRDGDEYVRYDLPQEWQTYDYQKSTAKTVQQYCDELGFINVGSVVNYLNLEPITLRVREQTNTTPTKQFNYPILIILISVTVFTALIIVVVILKNHKKPTNKDAS